MNINALDHATDGIKVMQEIARDNATNGAAVSSPKVVAELVSKSPFEEGSKAAKQVAQNIQEVRESVQKLQKVAEAMGTKIRFSVNEKLGKIVVSVLDGETGRLLRQIPSEDVQNMQEHIRQAMGLLFNQIA